MSEKHHVVLNKSTNKEPPILYKCFPEDFYWLSPTLRSIGGFIILLAFSMSFLSLPICGLCIISGVLNERMPIIAKIICTMAFLSFVTPLKEVRYVRKMCQLLFELFDMRCNLSQSQKEKLQLSSKNNGYIVAMHPHGIIPIQVLLWSGYCEQYLPEAYGIGACANVVFYVPFLRNIAAALGGCSADYHVLRSQLNKSNDSKHRTNYSETVTAGRPSSTNLFIFPGGVAEVFTSNPGTHVAIFRKRKGLIKLAIETGCNLLPVYIFGGNEFYSQLFDQHSLLARTSRYLRMGCCIFVGQFWMPFIPFTPRVTMCMADPIEVPKWDTCVHGEVPKELIDDYHNKYIDALIAVFNKYKEVAGYPHATLVIE